MKTIFTGVKIMVSCPNCETQVEYSSSAEFQKCTWTQECGATFKVPKIELADASTESEKWETTVSLPVPGWAEVWEVANELSHLIRDHFSDNPYYDKPFYPQNCGKQIRIDFKAYNEAHAHTIAALSRKFLAQFDNVNGADVSVSIETDDEILFSSSTKVIAPASFFRWSLSPISMKEETTSDNQARNGSN